MTMILFCTILFISLIEKTSSSRAHSIPSYAIEFCSGEPDIYSVFGPYISGGYKLIFKKSLKAGTEIKIQLDSVGTITNKKAISTSEIDLINNVFSFVLLEDADIIQFNVRGKIYPNHPPYVLSIKINKEEVCKDPNRTYFQRPTGIVKLLPSAPNKFCGRRRINDESIPLIVSGSSTNPGHWPWHVAINKLTKGIFSYICGGTLLSKYTVLTAAHCATERGVPLNPEVLGVLLGKYSLHRIEITNQDREVAQVIVHDDFNRHSLNNDIALLKLKTEANFNNFVQTACLWFDEIYDVLPSLEITGTVVGWGINQFDILSKNLRTAVLPIVSDVTCIKYEPVFYTNMLNGKKFCAGNGNGTSACNGDSGGGFFVFVEDDRNYEYWSSFKGDKPGAWYVRGIVSATLKRQDADICDPDAYTVYTDVAKYRQWILNNMT